MATTHAVSLRDLSSFGDVAAEDDAVLEYFLTTDAVTRIKTGDVFIVLGRKGAGKTALVRHFAEGGEKVMSRSLNLGGYPWALHAQRVDRGASEMEAYVSSWRYLIAVQLGALGRAEHTEALSIEFHRFTITDRRGGHQCRRSHVLSDPRIGPKVPSISDRVL